MHQWAAERLGAGARGVADRRALQDLGALGAVRQQVLRHEQRRAQWNEAYANIDFCVHQQPHMTSTTIEDADLFLPMQEWLEFEHATETTTQFNQTFMRKQIVHMGETEDPFICVTRIVDSLCEKLGGDDAVLCRDFQFNGTYRTKEDIYPAWAEMFGVESWPEAVKHSEDHTLTVPIDELYQFYQHLDIVDDGCLPDSPRCLANASPM